MARSTLRPARPRPELYEGAVWWADLGGFAGLERVFLQRMQPGGPDGRGFHAHRGAQFLLAVHGHAELEQRAGTRRVLLRPGEGFSVPANVQHRWDAIPDGGVDVFAVTLSAAAPLETVRLGAQLAQAGRFTMPGKPADWIARMADLGAEVARRSAGRTVQVAARTLLILVEAARCVPAQAGPAEAGGGGVARAEAYLARRMAEPVSLEAAAEAAGVSAGHLVRLFKAERGTTPMRALARLRIEAAKTLLLTTDWDTARIALAVGLGNAQYFSRVFRQIAQEPPRAFRRRMRRAGLE